MKYNQPIQLTKRLLIFAGLSGTLLMAGCYTQPRYRASGVSAGVSFRNAPPQPRSVYYDTRQDQTWVQGRWEWRGNNWFWVDGYWEQNRPGYVYSQGYWDYNNGWNYQPGGWINSRPGYVYSQGYWGWNNGRYNWNRGNWIQQRQGYTYNRGRYVRQGNRYVWTGGQWSNGRTNTSTVRDKRRNQAYQPGPTQYNPRGRNTSQPRPKLQLWATAVRRR